MFTDVPNIIGLIGVALCLSAYVGLQSRKMNPNGILFSLMNFFASGSIIYSIFYHWNVAAFAMESAWMLLSFYGLMHAVRKYLKKKVLHHE